MPIYGNPLATNKGSAMKKIKLFLLLTLVAALFGLWPAGATPVQAQEELDTVLARAAARGFLTSLTRPDLAGVTGYYLLDSLKQDSLLAELQGATGYTITADGWISDVTYQVKAVLQPGNREIAVYTGKYNGRWQVEGIDLPSAEPAPPAGPEQPAAAATSAGGPAPVPDNGPGRLVFQTRSGGDIYVINANGTGLRRITHGIDPQLSPDGSKIAFTRWSPRYELFTINLDGSGEQAITHGWRQMKSPTWSADGSTLTFSWQNGGRLEDEQKRINLREAILSGDPIRVPGNAIGIKVEQGILKYTIPADAHWFLKQVNLNTGQITDLSVERHSFGPSGHPTRPEWLVYKGQNGIALHNTATHTDRPVSTDPADHTPVISPDGQRVAVSYWQNDHWEIHTMNIDGSGRQRLTSTPLRVLAERRQPVQAEVAGQTRYVAGQNPAWNNAAPVWSPDGSRIAFLTDRTGQWEIWLMNADGANQRPMFPNAALNGIALHYAGVDERMLSWR